jgi:large subunit ribosomal protein L32e
MSDHLTLRKEIKAKKPTFLRQDSHKQKKLAKVWRRPRGKTNKVRLRKRGYVRLLETGHGSPRDVKGQSPQGKNIRLVTTFVGILALNAKTDDVIISRTVGAKKKLEFINAMQKNKINILNIDAEAFMKQMQERKEKARQKKEEKKQAKPEKKEEKTTTTEELTEDDKKKKEKEEKDRLLTKRE